MIHRIMLGRERGEMEVEDMVNFKDLDITTILEIRVIQELAKKYGVSKARDVINDFGLKYKLKHKDDKYLYSHSCFAVAFDKYHKQKVNVFNRYCSRYHDINVLKEEKPYHPKDDRVIM